MTTITAKIQILPTQSDVQAMLDTFALYGRACNWLSKKVFETKTLNQFTLHKLFYETIRSEIGTKAQMTQSVIKTVLKDNIININNSDFLNIFLQSLHFSFLTINDSLLEKLKISIYLNLEMLLLKWI